MNRGTLGWVVAGVLLLVAIVVAALAYTAYQAHVATATTYEQGLGLLGRSIDSASGFVAWLKALLGIESSDGSGEES